MINREIKFRVWDRINKEMVKVLTIDFDDDGEIEEVNTSTYCWRYDSENHTDNIVLMQYTGLLDKKGIKIYEGDILCQKFGNQTLVGVMKFDVDRATFGMDVVIDTEQDIEGNHLILNTRPEVLGNIYQHPELIN